MPAPLSAFRDIEQLRDGELAVCRYGEIDRRHWWRLRFDRVADVDEIEAADQIRACWKTVSGCRCAPMFHSVPTYPAALIPRASCRSSLSRAPARSRPSRLSMKTTSRTKTATDVSPASSRTAAAPSITNIWSNLIDLPEQLDEVVRSFDEPFSGVISTYFITQSISQHVKVALSGDGADETVRAAISPHRLAAPLAAYAAGRNDPAASAPFENDVATARRASRPR